MIKLINLLHLSNFLTLFAITYHTVRKFVTNVQRIKNFYQKGPSINDVTHLGGGGRDMPKVDVTP